MKKVLEAVAVGLAWPAAAFVVRSIDSGTPTAPNAFEFVGAVLIAMVWFAMSRWAPHLRGAGWVALRRNLHRDRTGKR